MCYSFAGLDADRIFRVPLRVFVNMLEYEMLRGRIKHSSNRLRDLCLLEERKYFETGLRGLVVERAIQCLHGQCREHVIREKNATVVWMVLYVALIINVNIYGGAVYTGITSFHNVISPRLRNSIRFLARCLFSIS